MTVILLEALGALLLLALIVWWTMFAGRNKGELRNRHEHTDTAQAEAAPSEPGESVRDNSAPKS
ncbi:MAG: hypothetical protein WBC18_12170 [Ottowia sp.]|uniref:hypothetical protein n=1 Tax=unclassified Ottowia TaxID=2645081 RepID=UPI003C2BCA88